MHSRATYSANPCYLPLFPLGFAGLSPAPFALAPFALAPSALVLSALTCSVWLDRFVSLAGSRYSQEKQI